MHLLIKILDPGARKWYENNVSSHAGDSGFDLYFVGDVTINAMETEKVNFGIAIEALTDDGEPTSFWMVPRSSIVKTRLRMANSIGLIDAGYRGPLMAFVDNFSKPVFRCVEEKYYNECEWDPTEYSRIVMKEDTEETSWTVFEGERLFQIASPTLEPITYEIVEELSETSRGTGGFGSTGK